MYLILPLTIVGLHGIGSLEQLQPWPASLNALFLLNHYTKDRTIYRGHIADHHSCIMVQCSDCTRIYSTYLMYNIVKQQYPET